MRSEKNTLIDALNAELLGDVQKIHAHLVSFKDDMATMKGDYLALQESSESIKATLSETSKQFEVMAKGIVLFAKDERKSIEDSQQTALKETTTAFMKHLKVNTSSMKSQLWIIFALLGVNFILLVALFLKK